MLGGVAGTVKLEREINVANRSERAYLVPCSSLEREALPLDWGLVGFILNTWAGVVPEEGWLLRRLDVDGWFCGR